MSTMKVVILPSLGHRRTPPDRCRRRLDGDRDDGAHHTLQQRADDGVIGAAAGANAVMPACEFIHQVPEVTMPMPLLITE